MEKKKGKLYPYLRQEPTSPAVSNGVGIAVGKAIGDVAYEADNSVQL